MQIQCTLDPTRYSSKPSHYDAGKISSKLKPQEIELETFFDSILHGATFTIGNYNGSRSNENWKSQQIIGLDFDFKDFTKPFTVEEFIEKSIDILGIEPNLIYFTFGHKPEDGFYKYRVLYILDSVLEDQLTAQFIMKTFVDVVFKSDKQAKDSARMFYGTNRNIPVYYNILRPVQLEQMFRAIINHFKFEDSKSFKRNFENYCKQNGVIISDDMNIEHTIVYAQKSILDNNRTNMRHCADTIENAIYTKNEDWARFKGVYLEKTMNNLNTNCKLFNVLYSGVPDFKVEHSHWMILASTVLKFRDGLKILKHALSNVYPNNIEKFYRKLKSLNHSRMPEYSLSCKNYECPFYNECKRNGYLMIHQYELTKNKIQVIGETFRKDPLQDTRDQIKLSLEKETSKIIQADTGTGKSYQIQKKDKYNTFIAYPNNKLKQEQKKEQEKVNPFNAPYLTKSIYELGLPEEVLELLQTYWDNGISGWMEIISNAKDTSKNPELIDQYQKELYTRGEESLVSGTHALAIHDGMKSFPEIEHVIFDEDPIDTLLQVGTIDYSVLEKIKKFLDTVDTFPEVLQFINQVLDIKQSGMSVVKPTFSRSIWKKFIFRCWQNELITPNNSINILFDAEVLRRQDKVIWYGKKNELPKDKQITILSATIDETIYKYLYPDFEFIKTGKVEWVGKCYIHPERTFSRYGIDKMIEKEPEEVLRERVKQYIKEYKLDCLITFKTHKDKFKDMGIPIEHFGAVMGLNEYKGKNIGIIGTPFPSVIKSQIYYFLIHGEMDIDDKSAYQEIIIDEFRVNMRLPLNEKLKEIQIWQMKSEIEQAVGRARLVENDCTVHIFGVMPITGAQVVYGK